MLLEQGRAVMVVTGQQVGYLGGPFYTLLKAYHTVRLAAELERELGQAVLPLFWLEGEDHDLAEVRTAHYPDRTGEIRNLRYAPPEEVPGFEVGRYPVDATADIAQLAAALELPHEDGLALLRECYTRHHALGRHGAAIGASARAARPAGCGRHGCGAEADGAAAVGARAAARAAASAKPSRRARRSCTRRAGRRR